MKSSKISAVFLSKLSSILAKFKSSSTINVAHQQIKRLFGEYSYSDIILTFTSKMDNSDNLTDKEKKQYSKIYITLMDAYGQQIILDHYERFIESVAKKSVGVSEVVGHLCKTLLNRIYPTQNISNYIKHLLISFEKNIEIAKIIKQIMESFDPQLTAPFQYDMIIVINDKINLPRCKIQCLQAVLAIILSLQNRFTEEASIQPIIARHFKSDDWNTRKLCVDIAYGLLVVNNQANMVFHEYIKQLKYDKIKHVRDSVSNYNAIYRQLYGDEKTSKKSTQPEYSHPRTQTQKIHDREENHKDWSKKKTINRQFFENAGNKDVIKISQNKSSFTFKPNLSEIKVQDSDNSQKLQHSKKIDNFVEENVSLNFEDYLKDKKTVTTEKRKEMGSNDWRKKEIISPKNKLEIGKFKKQSKLAGKHFEDSENHSPNLKAEFQSLKKYFSSFQEKILQKINRLDERLTNLEKNQNKLSSHQNKALEESFNQRFNQKYEQQQKIPSISSSQYSQIQQSNLPEKIRQSIVNKNWDEAYTLALSNKNKEALFQLLSHQIIPQDELIQNCLMMQVRKNLTNLIVLKWLIHFIQTAEVGEQALMKIQKDINELPQKIKGTETENRSYWMLKKMICNQISEKIFS